MKRTISVLAGVAAAAGVGLVAPGVANADDSHINSCKNNGTILTCDMWWTNNAGATVGDVTFHAYGEHLRMSDMKSDGRGLYAKVWWSGQSPLEYRVLGGVGDGLDKNFSIKDGTVVNMTACQTDNGKLLNCRTGNIKA